MGYEKYQIKGRNKYFIPNILSNKDLRLYLQALKPSQPMKRLMPALSLLFIVALNSCTNLNKVSVTDTNFGDTIEVQQNLAITFSQDLVPDSLVTQWDSTAYFKIEPAVKGLFRWESKRQIVFSPEGGFKPATAYTIKLNPILLKHAKKGMELSAEPIKFRTPSLTIMGIQTSWMMGTGSPDNLTLQATLNFNFAIQPTDLSKRLRLTVNGRNLNAQIITTTPGTDIVIKAEGVSQAEAASGKLEVMIEKGIKCMECGQETMMELMSSILLTPVSELTISQVEPSFEQAEGFIRVYTNQPIMAEGLASKIKVNPSPEYKIELMESGFILRGAFAAGSTYEITIDSTLRGQLGGKMNGMFLQTVSFGQQEPGLVFTNSKGMYLSSKGSRKIGVKIININKVQVNIVKIYENNILAFMQRNRYNDYEEEGNGEFSYSDYALEQYGDEVFNKEYDVKNLPRLNGTNLLSLDFDDEIPFKGVYLVSVRAADNQWMRATKLISVSDIGLIARWGDGEVTIFANSIKDATSLNDVKVKVTSTNNQVLFTGTTNGDGMVKFTGLNTKFPRFSPGLITVQSGADFNFMILNDANVELSRFETGGYRPVSGGYMAFLYGDREIYRPGDTLYANAIVRNAKWGPVADLPVKLKLLMPNGRELNTVRKNLNKQGAADSKFVLPAGGITGTYSLELYAGNDVLLSSKTVQVEEFIPDRISIKTNVSKEKYAPGDSVVVTAKALNLFGPPAAGRNYEVIFNLNRSAFTAKGYEEYNFGIQGTDKISFPSANREGKTESDGSVIESFYINPDYKETGLLSGKVFMTVFDETGRPVNRVQGFTVQTQEVFLGVKTSDNYAAVGQAMQLGLIAMNGEEKAVTSSAKMQILKIDYNNILERTYDDRYHYVSQSKERILKESQVTIGNKGMTIPFIPNESGEYRIRLFNQGSDRYVEETFYAYGWGYTQSGAFAVNTEGTVDISTDKENYAPGDKAKLLFKTPFNGRLLVTVERNKVMEYHYLQTDKKTAELSLCISEEHLPTVYVTATLFRPLDNGSIPLTVAHGVIPVHVQKASNKLPVEIKVATQSKSSTTQLITVKTKPLSDIEVTLAVVDEGILQLRNTKSPDPYEYFYQKRALEVAAYDVYPYVMPDLSLKRSSVGGDGYDLAKRVNPITNKRVKLIAAWSGILKTNGAGIATYSMKIPQFSGDLRVMAVAYKDNAFGSAEAHIKVADPVVISTALPRFVSPGDTVIVPVTLTNTTNAAITVTPNFTAVGLKIVSSSSTVVALAASAENRISCKLVAPLMPGEASFTVKLKTGNVEYTDLTDITVRPAAGLQVRNGNGVIKGGESGVIDLNTGFIPSSAVAKVILSKSPVVAFADQLSYLLDYPHGCAEQTTSIAFPQLYYPDLAKSILNKPGRIINVQLNVNAAIAKVQSQQVYNGGISTWSGANDENWWTSVYVAHFLTEAKNSGYAVNENGFDKLIDYLAIKAKSKQVEELYYYDQNNQVKQKTIPAKDVFYTLYVLALNGRADKPAMNYYKTQLNILAIDSRYLLAAAYLLSGDRKSYAEVLPKTFAGEKSLNASGGNYYSYIRDEAISLNALLMADPDNIQIPEMVQRLSTEIKQQTWMSTQERAFAFLALGKFSKMANASTVTATVNSDGGKQYTFNGSDLVIDKGVTNNKLTVTASGKGNLYYFWKSSGLTKDGSFVQEDKILKVRKTFLNRFGQPLSGTTFLQNDLVVVKITLENSARNRVENIVVTDILPAGFEIENPRVSAVPELAWIKDNAPTENMDIRDDRINLYTSIGSQPLNFYYLVRAVSTGNFVMGPVSADAMYAGEYHSINGAGRVIIRAK